MAERKERRTSDDQAMDCTLWICSFVGWLLGYFVRTFVCIVIAIHIFLLHHIFAFRSTVFTCRKMPGLFASLDCNNEERWLYFIRFVASFHIFRCEVSNKISLIRLHAHNVTQLIHVQVLRLSKRPTRIEGAIHEVVKATARLYNIATNFYYLPWNMENTKVRI